MLIGIVFGSYYAIQSKAGEPVTLWTQVRRAVQTAAETRQFGVGGFLQKNGPIRNRWVRTVGKTRTKVSWFCRCRTSGSFDLFFGCFWFRKSHDDFPLQNADAFCHPYQKDTIGRRSI